jgi:hypothetical protein
MYRYSRAEPFDEGKKAEIYRQIATTSTVTDHVIYPRALSCVTTAAVSPPPTFPFARTRSISQSLRSCTITMRISQPLSILAASLASAKAQNAPVAPTLTLLYSMACDLGERFSLGPVPYGRERYVIPIVGGTFKGPRIAGRTP